MPRIRDSANQPRSLPWRILICLALAAFLLRAVVPNGFMAAPSASNFTLALCSAAGSLNITLDVPEQSDDKHVPADTCAFGALAAHVVLPETILAPVLSAAQARTVPDIAVYHAAPALPPLGPPLGSRAPPSLSA